MIPERPGHFYAEKYLTLESPLGITIQAVFKIGEVAARSGVSIDTLRYYERMGLLPQMARIQSGYRVYDPKTIDRIAFIKRAKGFGFTLDEICDLVRAEPVIEDFLHGFYKQTNNNGGNK